MRYTVTMTFICTLLILSLVVSFPVVTLAGKPSVKQLTQPSVSANAAAVIDVHSGRIIYSQQGDKQMRIASLTKIMTAIVAIEQGVLSDQVVVGKQAVGVPGSSLYLKLGEEMSLEHLLYGLMLRSGNDAAVAIAEHVGGSLDGFAYLMNEKANAIGMDHSHFMNPHGLDAEGHYSTANDLAKLTAYALKNPVFQEIVKTKVKIAPNSTEAWDHKWANKNKMLNLYDGADGVKTGYTKLSRRCLVSSATRNGQQLAVVTLSDANDWADHSRLLDYGFAQFPEREIVKKGELMQRDQLLVGKTLVYPLTDQERTLLSAQTVINKPGSIADRLGEKGWMQVYLDGVLIAKLPLYEPGSPRMSIRDSQVIYQERFTKMNNQKYVTILTSVMKALFNVMP